MTMDIVARNWRELIRPKGIQVEKANATYGKFVAEPFERG
jgi:DNA-directed RNA polymerase subunit alpha